MAEQAGTSAQSTANNKIPPENKYINTSERNKRINEIRTDTTLEQIETEGGIRNSIRVTDRETLSFLNEQKENGDVIHTFTTMQIIDGKLYSPMAAKVKNEQGKYELTPPNTLEVWQQVMEEPDNSKIKNG